ncbi:hypothetical protein Micbo1qcDRAFT_166665 [Microdochium bolleyi]|uniref:SnoaL-like domain-containing protein n=1 Tax=Microdochium bolleyi TaxID=196109 RepID=A0A136IUM1_9PEZI|nr:hypothetical protein Micbo1qcDRAFT_166665 [Microdochium bolleyi]
MAPSELYTHLLDLAQRHAAGADILSLRHRDAVHRWGHARLVSQHPCLQHALSNADLLAHFQSTGKLLESCKGETHDIMVDEHQRKATIWMSYFLVTVASEEVVENDLIWTLRFSDEEKVEDVRIVESVEFIDATASGRANQLLRQAGVEIGEDVMGGLGVVLWS